MVTLINLANFLRAQGTSSVTDTQILKDRSHFKHYTLKKQFLVRDSNPENKDDKTYYTTFNIYAKQNKDEGSGQLVENEFYFDMYNYHKEYTSADQGPAIDMTGLEFDKVSIFQIEDTMLTPLKLKNNFYKAELKIKRNDCLTLFMFYDSEESTKMRVYKDRHDVHFDFREQGKTHFSHSVENYWGHSRESYDVMYNDVGEETDEVFLKVVCPYFSIYGENKLEIGLKLIHEDYFLDGRKPERLTGS